MNSQEAFKEIMAEQKLIALATSVATIPNVRIVRFFYDEHSQKTYFTTYKDSVKTKEFKQNQQVAFTTIPPAGHFEHVRSLGGVVKKSQRPLAEVKAGFIEKEPRFAVALAQSGSYLELYEISCPEYLLALDYQRSEKITIA